MVRTVRHAAVTPTRADPPSVSQAARGCNLAGFMPVLARAGMATDRPTDLLVRQRRYGARALFAVGSDGVTIEVRSIEPHLYLRHVADESTHLCRGLLD